MWTEVAVSKVPTSVICQFRLDLFVRPGNCQKEASNASDQLSISHGYFCNNDHDLHYAATLRDHQHRLIRRPAIRTFALLQRSLACQAQVRDGLFALAAIQTDQDVA